MVHIGPLGPHLRGPPKLGHIWATTSIYGNMGYGIYRENWYGNIGEFVLMGVVIREKWEGNMQKIWVNIVGNQWEMWEKLGGKLGKISGKFRVNLGKLVWKIGKIQRKLCKIMVNYGENYGKFWVNLGKLVRKLG